MTERKIKFSQNGYEVEIERTMRGRYYVWANGLNIGEATNEKHARMVAWVHCGGEQK